MASEADGRMEEMFVEDRELQRLRAALERIAQLGGERRIPANARLMMKQYISINGEPWPEEIARDALRG